MNLLYPQHPDRRSLELELRNLSNRLQDLEQAGKKARTRDRGIQGAMAAAPLPMSRGEFAYVFVAAGTPLLV